MRKIFFIFIFLFIALPVSAQETGQIILQTEIPIPGEVPVSGPPIIVEVEEIYTPTLAELQRSKAEKMILADIQAKRSQFVSQNKTALEYNKVLLAALNDLGAWAEKNPAKSHEVRQMLKYQSDLAAQITPEYEKLMSKNKVRKFFFGSDYGRIADLQAKLKKSKRNLAEFQLYKESLRLNEDWEAFNKNFFDMKNIVQEISNDVNGEYDKFSMFGWIKKIFV